MPETSASGEPGVPIEPYDRDSEPMTTWVRRQFATLRAHVDDQPVVEQIRSSHDALLELLTQMLDEVRDIRRSLPPDVGEASE